MDREALRARGRTGVLSYLAYGRGLERGGRLTRDEQSVNNKDEVRGGWEGKCSMDMRVSKW